MGITETFICAVGLASDAFAASVSKGTAKRKPAARDYAAVGLWFGLFQAAMPVLGSLCGSVFYSRIAKVDHWVAFLLLAFIGLDMILSSVGEKKARGAGFSMRSMLPIAFGTSVDAFAAGISLSAAGGRIPVLAAAGVIGGITALLSVAGLKIGSVFGARSGKSAQRAGGTLLILLGGKILLEHLISHT